MLYEFITAHRETLIARCRSKAAQRSEEQAQGIGSEYGIPRFLDQLVKTLRVEQTSEPMRSRKVSGPAGGGTPVLSEIGVSAAQHGRDLLQRGCTVDQVVHEYGDLCQAITELAFEQDAAIHAEEFQTLNRCLDNAIADAVTEFGYQRDISMEEKQLRRFNERFGFIAHELRNLLSTARIAVGALKAGNVGLTGATGAVLDRSLVGMGSLIDRSLADVRVAAGMPVRQQLISVADLIGDIKLAASLEVRVRGCELTVTPVAAELAVQADRDMLLSAVSNLLQNAFKFTKQHTEVSLNAYAAADRIRIDVEDHCGGLPPGDPEELFLPFRQSGADKSGLGLGLSICRTTVEANKGFLSVRNLPGSGCTFTIDLPRHSLAQMRGVPLMPAPS